MPRSLYKLIPLTLLALSGCTFAGVTVIIGATATPTPTATGTPTPSPLPTATGTNTLTPIITLTPSQTPTPTLTLTPSLSPTFDYPDAVVLEQANCRYGPGAAYLYEWGLFPGDELTILARNDLGTFVYVKPKWYVGECWVTVSVLEITGDVFSVAPYYGILPLSDLYKPPQCVQADRNGNEVTIVWCAVYMTEDDYRGYLVEAWLCQDRQIIFTPVSIIVGTSVTLIDEPGCLQPSGGRLYTAEKHGYTQWILIPWPPHDPTSTPSPTP